MPDSFDVATSAATVARELPASGVLAEQAGAAAELAAQGRRGRAVARDVLLVTLIVIADRDLFGDALDTFDVDRVELDE